ncbi:tetratricopeptide repeat protein [Porphyromonas sp.]|uniref:tetratricopeptide repeat protein n=1 Tax=Porphyromonas sp. TaxID=1924944 RepID=UPI0026DBA705|nr:tetratricopeptide repeat protein [Porphyromonas sp.]MDO4695482.1 tetratricopeptide repeat protein [Porphyromonas sp.]MDO4770284.1 tetratricopeptide repeat protein [Porphyromonas sp.]
MKTRIWQLFIIIIGLQGLSKEVVAQIDTDRVITIGRNAISFKDYVLAIQYFNTAIRYSPEIAEPYFYRGVAKYSLDDLHGTEEDCNLCLERNPYIYQAYFLRAIARHTLGKDTLALSDYEKVLKNNPDDQGSLHNISLLYISQKDTISARKTLERLKRFYPTYSPTYLIEGGIALSQKDTVAAKALFKKGAELNPTATSPYVSLAGIAYAQKDYHQALDYLNRALFLDPEAADLYTNRGLIHFQLNNLRGAMADYTTAIDLKSNNLLALYNRALLRSRVGELHGAVEDFNIILQYEPGNSFAHFNRGLLLTNLGFYSQARTDFDYIIDRHPTFIPAYLQRASVLRNIGDVRGAEIDMYRASQIMNDLKVRASLKKRGGNSRSSIDSNDDPNTKDTRDERDDNIRKFRMLVYDGRKKGYNDLYQSEENLRGRIQDRKGSIEPEPMYILSYYEKESKGHIESNTYNNYLGHPNTPYSLKMVRQLPLLNERVISEHQKNLESPIDPANMDENFARVMDLLTLKDYSGAKVLIEKMLKDEKSTLTSLLRFQYATTLMYLRSLEEKNISIEEVQAKKRQRSWETTLQSSLLSSSTIIGKKLCEEALHELEILKASYPEDRFILYNIGCVYQTLGAHEEAIKHFALAIAKDNQSAASYFNKALSHYALGEKAKGDNDMSLAGSLGLYKAYSIIKRMQQ